MNNHSKKFIAWILIVLLILIPSLIDLKGVVKTFWADQDKHFHLITFALFMVVTNLLFSGWKLWKIVGTTFLLGFIIEILQELLTQGNRQFHVADIIYNLIGIGLGLTLILIYRGIQNGTPPIGK
jgi:glycopeptide antibiotics resistance protein